MGADGRSPRCFVGGPGCNRRGRGAARRDGEGHLGAVSDIRVLDRCAACHPLCVVVWCERGASAEQWWYALGRTWIGWLDRMVGGSHVALPKCKCRSTLRPVPIRGGEEGGVRGLPGTRPHADCVHGGPGDWSAVMFADHREHGPAVPVGAATEPVRLTGLSSLLCLFRFPIFFDWAFPVASCPNVP